MKKFEDFKEVKIEETESINGGFGSFTYTVDPNTGQATCGGFCPVVPGFGFPPVALP